MVGDVLLTQGGRIIGSQVFGLHVVIQGYSGFSTRKVNHYRPLLRDGHVTCHSRNFLDPNINFRYHHRNINYCYSHLVTEVLLYRGRLDGIWYKNWGKMEAIVLDSSIHFTLSTQMRCLIQMHSLSNALVHRLTHTHMLSNPYPGPVVFPWQSSGNPVCL